MPAAGGSTRPQVPSRGAEQSQPEPDAHAMEEAARRYRVLLDGTSDALYSLDLDYRFRAANQAACVAFRRPEEELIGRAPWELGLHEEAVRLGTELLDQVRLTGQAVETSRSFLLADGSPGHYELLLRPVFDGDGQISGIAGRHRDVTACRAAEEALAEGEERHRLIIDSSPNAIVVYSEGRIVEANTAAVRLTGAKDRAELISRPVLDFVHADSHELVRKRMDLALGGGGPLPNVEERLLDFGGRPREVEVTTVPTTYRGRPAATAIIRGLSELKAAERALRASEAQLRAAQRLAGMGSWSWEVATDSVTWSEELYTIYGRDPGLPAPAYAEQSGLHTPASWLALTATVERALTGGEPYELELEIIRPGGERRWIATRGAPLRDQAGAVVGLHGTVQDIHERKQVEKALAESEERYRTFVDSSHDIMMSLDLEGRFTFLNRAFEEVTGYQASEVLGQEFLPLILPEDLEVGFEAYRRVAAGAPQSQELRVITRAGSVRDIAVNAVPLIQDGVVTGVVGFARDVTEQKRAEEALRASEAQLRQMQKLEAVGQLAGGIAHDFNNLLTPIIGASDLLLADWGTERLERSDVEEIRQAAKRAATLTRQLLAFSRQQPLEPRVLDLNQVVEGLHSLLSRLLEEDIDFVTRLEPGLPAVEVDPTQIEQVIMNLAVNARDAMPRGGKLLIETRSVELDEGYAARHPGARPGPHVLLALSDTGTGMDAETQARIFEPFFTTKEPGKGTGLGLSTVYGIVQQSEGSLWVYSEPGKGSTFKVYLPVCEAQAKEAGERAKPPAPSLAGKETVLVVEDEDAVRGLVVRLLRRQGYRVLQAASGSEALDLVSQNPRIDLLLTDVILPGVDGRELMEKAREISPTMKTLFMSGYTRDAIVHSGRLDPGIALLEKPFTPEGLAQRVREVLDG